MRVSADGFLEPVDDGSFPESLIVSRNLLYPFERSKGPFGSFNEPTIYCVFMFVDMTSSVSPN